MKKAVLTVMAFVAIGGAAFAIPPFGKEFDAMYVKPGSDLEAKVKEVKCNLCHEGTKKTDRNAYGMALSELLDKKADAKNPDKIRKALETVAAKPSNGDGSPTFGELIKMGKLPAGN